jgi:hypothetical protein
LLLLFRSECDAEAHWKLFRGHSHFCGEKLPLQIFGGSQQVSFNNLVVLDAKNSHTRIAHARSRGAEPREFDAKRAGVGDAGNHLLAFGDQFVDLIVKIGERGTDAVDIRPELVDSVYYGPDRAAENDTRRNQFVECLRTPLIPQLRAIPLDQYFSVHRRFAFLVGAHDSILPSWVQQCWTPTGYQPYRDRRRTQQPI